MFGSIRNLICATIILEVGILFYSNVAAQSDSSCRLFIFKNANPNILNSTYTDIFISQIKTCVGQEREKSSKSSLKNKRDNCEEFVCALNCLTYVNNNGDVHGNLFPKKITNFLRERYVALDWAKPLSNKVISNCIHYGTNQGLNDKKHKKYSCNSQIYHFATCFFDGFDKLYENHMN